MRTKSGTWWMPGKGSQGGGRGMAWVLSSPEGHFRSSNCLCEAERNCGKVLSMTEFMIAHVHLVTWFRHELRQSSVWTAAWAGLDSPGEGAWGARESFRGEAQQSASKLVRMSPCRVTCSSEKLTKGQNHTKELHAGKREGKSVLANRKIERCRLS